MIIGVWVSLFEIQTNAVSVKIVVAAVNPTNESSLGTGCRRFPSAAGTELATAIVNYTVSLSSAKGEGEDTIFTQFITTDGL